MNGLNKDIEGINNQNSSKKAVKAKPNTFIIPILSKVLFI